MNKSIDEILLSAYYKGKDDLGYSEFELKADKQALYDLILSEMMVGYVAADDLGNDAYKAQERLLNHQRHQLAQLFGREG